MFKKINKKGFTLAELLIVVAIIGVLVAISIPIFTAQLEKARDATSVANMRSAYAQAQTAVLTSQGDTNNGVTFTAGTTTSGPIVKVANVAIESAQANTWSNLATELPFTAPDDPGAKSKKTMVFTYGTDFNLSSVTFE